jgi:hypothetical protein
MKTEEVRVKVEVVVGRAKPEEGLEGGGKSSLVVVVAWVLFF